MYNEIFADRSNVETERERLMYDSAGNVVLNSDGTPMYEKYKASDYEYYKSILKMHNDANYEQFLVEQDEERKESMNGFVKFLSDVAGIGTSYIGGAASIINGITGTTSALFGGAARALRGENFSDAFLDISTDEKYRFLQFVEDWAVEFESRYTGIRDINGNYTNIGKYVGGISRTLGQLLPSMLAAKGLGKIGTAVGMSSKAAASTASVASQIIFYQGITGSNIKDMYDQFSSQGISVTSAQLLSNALLKSTFEYAIEIGLGKLLGGSAIDNVIFGRTAGAASTAGGGLASAALRRVLKDAGQEGLEEVLQDTSSFLVDRAYMLLCNENFGNITELNPQSLMDAYFIGAIVSIGGSAKGVMLTSNKKAKEFGIEGNYVTRKLRAWEYGLNVQSFVENYQEVLDAGANLDLPSDMSREELFNHIMTEGRKSNYKFDGAKVTIAAMSEMLAAYRMLTSIYGEIGAERFEAANKLLTEITSDIKKGKYDTTVTHMAANALYASIFGEGENNIRTEYLKSKEVTTETTADTPKDSSTSPKSETKTKATKKTKKSKTESKEEVVAKIEDGKHTAIKAEASRGTPIEEVAVSDDVKKELDKIFAADSSIEKIVITTDGDKITTVDDVILVPSRLVENAGANTVLQGLFENRICKALLATSNNVIKLYIKEVVDTYRKYSGLSSATELEALTSLMLDPEGRLFKIMLMNSNKDTLKFLGSLLSSFDSDIDASAFSNLVGANPYSDDDWSERTFDADAHTRYRTLCENLKNRLYDYLVVQPYANLNDYKSVLGESRIKELKRIHYSNDIYSRVLRNETLSDADWNVLIVRIKNMTKDDSYKNTLLANLKSANARDRSSAIKAIDSYYKSKYYEKYDGETYLPLTSIPNMTFNYYLKDIGRTVKDFYSTISTSEQNAVLVEYGDINSDTILQYRQKEFTNRTNGLYSFIITKTGKVSIKNKKNGKIEGFSNYYANSEAIMAGSEVNDFKMSIPLGSSAIGIYLNESLNEVQARMISVNDIIYQPELLSEQLYRELKSTYPSMDAESVFVFLRDKVVEASTGTLGLTMNSDGECIISSLRSASNLIENPIANLKDGMSLSEIFKRDVLTDFSANTKIKFTDDNIVAEYRPYKIETIDGSDYRTIDNTIYVNRSAAKYGGPLLKFAILHEFQHVIQFENRMNLGLDSNFMAYLSPKEKARLIKSVVKNMPHLFNNEMDDAHIERVVSDYVYLASAESEAMGIGGTKYMDFYPVVVKVSEKGSIITLPTGEEFLVDGKVRSAGSMPLRKLADNLYMVTDIKDFFNSFEIDGRISDMNIREPSLRNEAAKLIIDYGSSEYGELSHRYTAGGFDVNYDRETIKRKMKEILTSAAMRPYRYSMINSMRELLTGGKVSMEEFLDMDVPFIRLQTSEELNDSAFVSVFAGATSTAAISNLLNISVASRGIGFFPEVHLIAGTFKPKDCLSYWPTFLSEAFVEPSKLVESKVFKLLTDSLEAEARYYLYSEADREEPDHIEALKYGISPELQEGPPIKDTDGKLHTKYALYGDLEFARWGVNEDGYYGTITLIDGDTAEIFRYNATNRSDFSYVLRNASLNTPLFESFAHTIDYMPGDRYTTRGDILNLGSIFYMTTEDGRVITDEEVSRPIGPYIPKMSLAKTIDDETKPVKKSPGRKKTAKSYVTTAKIKGTDRRRPTFAKKTVKTVDYEKDGQLYRKYYYEPSSRYITAEEAKNTNLKYFRKKGAQYSPEFKKFVVMAKGERKVDPVLQDKIDGVKKGTLTERDIKNYFRKTPLDKMDQTTFELINEVYYQNKQIKTPEQLSETLERLPDYYAVRAVAISLGYQEQLRDNFSISLYENLLQVILKNEKLNTLYTQIKGRYYTYEGNDISLYFNEETTRHNTMRYFDGSLHRAGHVASVAKTSAILNRHYNEGKVVSLDSVVGDVKGDGGGRAMEEIIADESSNFETKDRYDSIQDLDLSDPKERQIYKIMMYVQKTLFPKAAKRGSSPNAIKTVFVNTLNDLVDKDIREISTFADDFKDEDVRRAYIGIMLAEILDVDLHEADDAQMELIANVADELTITSSDYNTRMRGYLRTINLNCSKADAKRVIKDNSDILEWKNNKICLKDSAYKYEKKAKNGSTVQRLKSAEELAPLADRLLKLSSDIKRGVYTSDKALKIKKESDKKMRKMMRELSSDASKKATKAKNIKAVEISDDILEFTSTKEMPSILSKILDFEFTETARSKTKYVTNEDSHHYKNNYRTFCETNAKILSSLTSADVDAILDWYLNSIIIAGRITERRKEVYDAVEVYLLTYLLKTGVNDFILTPEQRDTLSTYVERKVRSFSTGMANWRIASQDLNPDRIIINSLKKRFNVEFSEDSINKLENVMTDYLVEDEVDKLPYSYPDMSYDVQVGMLKDANILPDDFDSMSDVDKKKLVKRYASKKSRRRNAISDVQKAKDALATEALEQYRKHGVSFWDRLLTLQQSFMLSGPGTWLRNLVSNVSLSYFNFAADYIGDIATKTLGKIKAMPEIRNRIDITADINEENASFNKRLRALEESLAKTSGKEGEIRIKDQIKVLKREHAERLEALEREQMYSSQYNLTKTKVSEEVSKFIKDDITPLLSIVGEDMSKYDPRSSDRKSSTVQLVELIAANITSRLYREELAKFELGDTKTHQFMAKAWNSTAGKFIPFVFKMMSDDKFVHKKAVEYLGKMLTEDLKAQSEFSSELASLQEQLNELNKKYNEDVNSVRREYDENVDKLNAKHSTEYDAYKAAQAEEARVKSILVKTEGRLDISKKELETAKRKFGKKAPEVIAAEKKYGKDSAEAKLARKTFGKTPRPLVKAQEAYTNALNLHNQSVTLVRDAEKAVKTAKAAYDAAVSSELIKLQKERDNRIKELNSSKEKSASKLQSRISAVKSESSVINLTNVSDANILKYVAEAYTMASFDYMHKTNFWNKAEAELRRWGGPSFMFMYKQIMPFASAGWNWFIESLQYSPAALVMNINKLYKLEKTVEDWENKRQKGARIPDSRLAKYTITRNIGKGIIGTFNFIIGSLFAAFGWVGLDDEDDKYKLRVGDNIYIDISSAYGASSLWAGMTMFAMLKDCMQDNKKFEINDVMEMLAAGFDVMFADSAFSDLHNTFRYNDTVGDWIVELPMQTLNMFVPNLLKTVNSLLVVYDIEYDKGIVGDLERYATSIVPFLAYAFPKYIDPYTGEKQLAYNFHWLDTDDKLGGTVATVIFKAINKVSTIDITPYNVSDLEKEAISVGVRKSALTGKYTVDGNKVNLSISEIEKLNVFYGQLNNAELNRLMSDKVRYEVKDSKGKYVKLTYSQMTDEQKKTVIERIMSDNGEYAKIYALTSSGMYKYYANSSEYMELKNLGITENVYRISGKNKGFVPID